MQISVFTENIIIKYWRCNVRNNRYDENFKANIKALSQFMRDIVYFPHKREDFENEVYEQAKKWLLDHKYDELYKLLSSKSFVCENAVMDLYVQYEKEVFACTKDCFTITRSTVKVDNKYICSNEKYTFSMIRELLDILKLNEKRNIFRVNEKEYAFHIGNISKNDRLEKDTGDQKSKKHKAEISDNNYEMLRKLLLLWHGKKGLLSNKLTFNDYLYTTCVLKSLVPPFYTVDNSSHKIIEKDYQDYNLDYSIIDNCVFEYYIEHAIDINIECTDGENLKRYSHVLEELGFDASYIRTFVETMTSLKVRSPKSFFLLMSKLNSNIYKQVNEWTQKAKYCAEDSLIQNSFYENDDFFENRMNDIMSELNTIPKLPDICKARNEK